MRGECRSLPWVALFLFLVTVLATAGWAGQISFTGKVLDSQGNSVPDANVVFYEVNYEPSAPSPSTRRVQGVVTGPDGAFAFTTARESDGYKQGYIIARKEGLALGWAAWETREGDQKADITLGEPKELSGVIVDEGDDPIVDAAVSIAIAIIGNEEDRRYLTYFVAPQLLTVRTDSTGRFVFSNMPAEATFEFLAKKSGRASASSFDAANYRGEKCQYSPGQAGIKLTLPVEARLEGRVVEKSGGKPSGGILISVQPDQRGLPFLVESVASAADGSFSVGNLLPGGYTVQLAQQRTLADWVAEPVKVNLKTGETIRDVQLSLSKGGLLEVFVKEEKSGKPIEKANVSVLVEAPQQWVSGATDAGGIARIRLAAGNYRLGGVYKEDYANQNQEEAFAITEGETTRIERTLGGRPTVSGVVYDDTGKPLEGAVVKVLPGGGRDGTSDAEGKFEVAWDPQGWSGNDMVFYLVVRHVGRNLAVAQPVEEGRIEVKLRPAATLTGTIVDPDGKGLAGATPMIMLQASRWGSSFLQHGSVKADAEGEFEVGAIPAEQRYDIIASADGYGQARITLSENQVNAGKVEAGRFSLPLANLSVSGIVVDSEGKPMSGANVSCYGGYEDNQPNRNTRADSEGRFVLDRVCAGRINISANAQSGGINLNGYIQTEGGAKDIQLVISDRSSARAYVPRKPVPLKGKPLPDLKKLGIELPADANDRMLLVCFWDMNQRPSRHCMSEVIRRAPQLAEKGVAVVAVHGVQLEQTALDQWVQQNKVAFPVGCLRDKVQDTQFEWGVVSLPHLILTDKKHVVVGEGFGLLGELDKHIEEASGR